MAHIYVEYIHIFVEIRGRVGVCGGESGTHLPENLASIALVGFFLPLIVSTQLWYPESHSVMQPSSSCMDPEGSLADVGQRRSRKRGSVFILLTRSSLHTMVLSLVAPAKIVVAYLIQPVAVQCRLTTIVG